jgi:hypothetical protein
MKPTVLDKLEPGLFVPQDPVFEFNFDGCGSQKDYYQERFSEIKDAVLNTYSKFAGRRGLPYLRTNLSVGNLKSEPKDYYAALLTPGRSPYEWDMTFNQDNPESLGPYRTGSAMNHEFVHAITDSLGYDLSEYQTEKANVETLKKTGKEKIARPTELGSNYI